MGDNQEGVLYYIASETDSTRKYLSEQLFQDGTPYSVEGELGHFGYGTQLSVDNPTSAADLKLQVERKTAALRLVATMEWFLMQHVDDAVLTSSSSFALTAFATTGRSPVSVN